MTSSYPHLSAAARDAKLAPREEKQLVLLQKEQFGDFSIGQMVLYENKYLGQIKFIGTVKGREEVFVGLDMVSETFENFDIFD